MSFTLAALVVSALASAAGADSAVSQEAKKQAAKETSAAKKADPVAQIDAFITKQKGDGKIDPSKPTWKTSMPFPPLLEFDASKNYYWNLETNKGDVKIRLLNETAPMHVSSTIYLVRSGFYDGLTFHRVITDFMAQGGCPLGRGNGSPGYKYDGEFDPKVKHDKPGLLSMANAGPGTDGSQFFLTFVPTPWLDGKHTIFGEVVSDMSVLKALEAQGSARGSTKEPLLMVKSTISVEDKSTQAKEAKATKAVKKEGGV